MSPRHIQLASLFLGGAACSLANLEGLTDSVPLTDGGTGPDGGLVAPNDGGPPRVPDAAGDSGEAATPWDGATPCGQTHAFCDDFDRSEDLVGWTRELLGTGASVELTTAHFLSGPRALRSRVGVAQGAAFVSRTFSTSTQRVAVAFDCRVGATSTSSSQVFRVTLSSPPGVADGLVHLALHESRGTVVAFQSRYRKFADGGDDFAQTPFPSGERFPPQTWVHFEVELGATFTIRLTRPGEGPVSLFTAIPPPHPRPLATIPSIEVGISDNSDANTEAVFDNIVVDF